jgi:geranylgeranyl diphosphate synthase type II
MDLRATLKGKRQVIEVALERHLPDDGHSLTKAMRYSLFAGGKRLRPILALLCYEAAEGSEPNEILPPACALEYVHTSTLIHDDLPAVDNDDFRRGKPSNHKVFGEGMAIMAGDALIVDGLGLMARSTADPRLVTRAVAEFSRILGAGGVTRGQVNDLYDSEVNPKFLRHTHLRKSALFISFSMWVGALFAGASEEVLGLLGRAGVLAGMGFQVRDDVLDVTSSLKELGKTPGKDEAEGKLTYPSLYGLQRSQRIAEGYARRARRIFAELGSAWSRLADLTDYLVDRRR